MPPISNVQSSWTSALATLPSGGARSASAGTADRSRLRDAGVFALANVKRPEMVEPGDVCTTSPLMSAPLTVTGTAANSLSSDDLSLPRDA